MEPGEKGPIGSINGKKRGLPSCNRTGDAQETKGDCRPREHGGCSKKEGNSKIRTFNGTGESLRLQHALEKE